jgi:hypothetical protein
VLRQHVKLPGEVSTADDDATERNPETAMQAGHRPSPTPDPLLADDY